VLDGATGAYGTANSLASVNDTPVVGTSNAAAKVTLTGADNWTASATPPGTAGLDTLALNNKVLGTADTRLGQTAPELGPDGTTDDAANNVVTLSGQVTDSFGLSTYSTVTLSAPGVMFVSGTVSSLGSITVNTSASGAYSGIKAYSNTAGKVTITATAGASSETLEVTFAAAAGNSGENVSVAVTGAVTGGGTMKVVVTITDKYGNPVKTDLAPAATALDIAYNSDAGFVVGGLTAIPTKTEADGTATFFVFFGNNDVVTGNVTATYRPSANADENITAVANFGAAASVDGQARGWTRFLDSTNELKIYARDVVGAGKVQFIVNGREIAWIRATSAADPKLNVANDGMVRSVFVRDMLVGRNVVEIYVDGERIARRIFTR